MQRTIVMYKLKDGRVITKSSSLPKEIRKGNFDRAVEAKVVFNFSDIIKNNLYKSITCDDTTITTEELVESLVKVVD